jgi:hypothetical protein
MHDALGLRLPPLDMPLPQRSSPHFAEIENHAIQWMAHVVEETGCGSVAWFRATNSVEFAAWLYPDADLDVACFVSDYCNWLFSMDDHHPHESNADTGQVMDLVGDCLGVLNGGRPHRGVSRILHELMDRFRAMVHPSQHYGLLSATSNYVSALGLHSAVQRSGIYLNPEIYWPIRLQDSAALPLLAMCQAGIPQLRSAPDLLPIPQYAALSRAACKIVCLSNDILSYPRERTIDADGRDYVFNSVAICRSDGKSLQNALDEVSREFAAEVSMFETLCAQLRVSDLPASHLYVDAFSYWTSGIDRWQKETGRYTDLWSLSDRGDSK